MDNYGTRTSNLVRGMSTIETKKTKYVEDRDLRVERHKSWAKSMRDEMEDYGITADHIRMSYKMVKSSTNVDKVMEALHSERPIGESRMRSISLAITGAHQFVDGLPEKKLKLLKSIHDQMNQAKDILCAYPDVERLNEMVKEEIKEARRLIGRAATEEY